MPDAVDRDVRGGRSAFFEDADVDRLLAMLTRLMTEHWALKERVMVLENLLAERGVLDAQTIAEWQPPADVDAGWDAESFALVQSVMEAGRNIKRS